jgi:hypothetical protein
MIERGRRTMDASARRDEPNIPADPTRMNEAHYRPVRMIGLLLILQVVGLVGIGVYEFASIDWEEVASVDWEEGMNIDLELIDPTQPPESELEALALQVAEAVVFIVFFLPPALMMLLAGLSFLLLKRRGWLLAAIAQGLSLGASLWIYTELNPNYIYPIMIYCIVMVMYLNSHDVRVVFHSRRDPRGRTPKATHGS